MYVDKDHVYYATIILLRLRSDIDRVSHVRHHDINDISFYEFNEVYLIWADEFMWSHFNLSVIALKNLAKSLRDCFQDVLNYRKMQKKKTQNWCSIFHYTRETP